ncbi:MAG: Hsp20/alpha crystallin family protein [Chloroflexota bacterium]
MTAQGTLPAPAASKEPDVRESRRSRRWDMAHLLEDVQADVAQVLGINPLAALGAAPGRAAGGWPLFAALPRVDVFDRDGSIVVKAELPGIRKEDVNLEIVEGDLLIRAHQESEKEVREEDFYRMERRSGDIFRRLPLPEGVQHDRIEASLKDGILEVTVPVAERKAGRPHRIAVS